MKHHVTIWLALIILVVAQSAFGATTPTGRLTDLFTAETVSASWFTSAFLAQVPTAHVELIVKQYQEALGDYVRAEGGGPEYTLVFSRGTAPATILLDHQAQITGLWFGLPQPQVANLEDALVGFTQLPGEISVLVVSEAGILGSINPQARLAVGSTFKLAVLAALKDQTQAGILDWESIVKLSERHVSLPSGILQNWPIETALTVETAASLMISLSDNTATDMLIDIIGRDAIVAYAGANQPFLSTRETFILKDPRNKSLLDAYRQSNAQSRYDMLPTLDSLPLPSAAIFADGPVALDIEWYYSVGELINLMAYVQDLPLMSINPGVASPADWQRIAYKGGSEPGVFNLTTWLVGHSGKSFAVSATWNHTEPLDETRFMTLYSGLIQALKQLDV